MIGPPVIDIREVHPDWKTLSRPEESRRVWRSGWEFSEASRDQAGRAAASRPM
jgi:hypothetical protein